MVQGSLKTQSNTAYIIHTSTKHEKDSLPATMSFEDGSKRSTSTTSESESCSMIRLSNDLIHIFVIIFFYHNIHTRQYNQRGSKDAPQSIV